MKFTTTCMIGEVSNTFTMELTSEELQILNELADSQLMRLVASVESGRFGRIVERLADVFLACKARAEKGL